ncbi:DUF2231 domain-containing protein [Planosporangium sp. 12N6]|uniref:DUF2231 domain-containing protein n=1 Tax=Planosporangium spinosum TaxID=3402278 RepID=UPI003CF82D68
MPDTVNGIPLHPLVVHAVVVLLPLACLGVVAIAVRTSWRARYGGVVVALAALATVAVPIATSSGESLERSVGSPGEHAELGDSLLWFAAPLLVAAVALYLLHRRAVAGASGTDAGPAARHSPLMLAVMAFAVVIALANLVQVYRVGDSGARAVWQGTTSRAPAKSR